MMGLLSEIIFSLLTLLAFGIFIKNINRIRSSILLGKASFLNDAPLQRWKNVFLLALGQKKMFRNPIVALLHLVLYIGFIIINIELIEIILDGIMGTHRILAQPLGKYYPLFINIFEILAFLVTIACIVFLVRRNILKIKRFISKDLNGWPRTDANNILIAEIILMSLFLLMNAADTNYQFIISSKINNN